jgi:hypothetical protein
MDVPIKPRDFLRRHPSQRRGYSVAQPFLGVSLMPDPNQPNQQNQTNPQAAQQAQAQQAQAAAGGRWQQILQELQQLGPVALQFLELFLQHMQPTPQGTAPAFKVQPNQQPADSWLENAAFNGAQACKAKGA